MTMDNLKDNLWSELAKWRERSELLKKCFEWTKERVFSREHPSTWFLSARSWNKNANAEEQGRTLSGLHSKYVLFLIDESGDIPVSVLKSAEQAMSAKGFSKIIQAGNPTSHDGMLYAASTELSHLWHMITITGDPDDPKRSPRIDKKWAEEQIASYGRDNPWVMSFILGKFPPSSLNTLLSPEEVEAAMNRKVEHDHYAFSQKRLGVDVARFGLDSTVIFPRQGLMAFQPVEMRGANSQEVAARVAQAKAKWGSEMECVDGTGGYGSGVVDSLRQAGHAPFEIHFGQKPMDARYFNKRSEMWFEMAEWVKRGGALPRLPGLKRELTTPLYTFRNGKFQLEEKDQIKARLGFSPNFADALCLTFSFPDQPTAVGEYAFLAEMRKQVKKDFDPYA